MESIVSSATQSIVVFILVVFILLGVVLIAIVHFSSTSRESDQMSSLPTGQYRKYLRRRSSRHAGLRDIPPPPDGRRDEEVEALLRDGRFEEGRALLALRLEEAKLAPVGSDAKIKRVAHYTALIDRS